MTVRAEAAAAPALPRFLARPIFSTGDRVDFTDVVIHSIARRLSELYGGNDVLNHIEAERLFQEALAALR